LIVVAVRTSDVTYCFWVFGMPSYHLVYPVVWFNPNPGLEYILVPVQYLLQVVTQWVALTMSRMGSRSALLIRLARSHPE
jgi:hypothetical protein